MSYSRGTPNFNLPQTQGSDKRDWSDTNAAFLAVDTALKTAGDTASSASSAASAAQQTADSANTAAASAQTAAGNAQSAASTAGELAQTAKSRADSAYTLAQTANTAASNASTQAQTAESNRGTIKTIKTATGSASKTLASLISELNSDITAQLGANKDIAVDLYSSTQAAGTPTETVRLRLSIAEDNGNWTFSAARIFSGALFVHTMSKAGSDYRYGIWNSSVGSWTNMGTSTTAGWTAKLIVLG